MTDRTLRSLTARLSPAHAVRTRVVEVPALDPAALFGRLRRGRGVLLESAKRQVASGRYSLVLPRSVGVLRAKGKRVLVGSGGRTLAAAHEAPLELLRQALRCGASTPPAPGLPFGGGAAGYLGYEARTYVEPACAVRVQDDLRLPDLYFLFFHEGVVIDHERGSAALFCAAPARRAARRLDGLERACRALPVASVPRPFRAGPPARSMGRADFVHAVRSAKEHIRRGDVFQANLSQRFSFPFRGDPWRLYLRLRAANPSPFFGFLDGGAFSIVCGSPERLLMASDGWVRTRPIAGTRRRGADERADRALSRELLLSPKERAEHVMLVDLERNDLGRVCRYGSVRVDEFMAVEQYSSVKHIVSNVVGRLRGDRDALDAVAALFPGGTITGAPKVRCMDIIDALEPVARGPYTGSLGYIGWDGRADLNIIIRSWVVSAGRAHLQVGAGIVADSSPEREYLETLQKAAAPLAALLGEAAASRLLTRLRREAGR